MLSLLKVVYEGTSIKVTSLLTLCTDVMASKKNTLSVIIGSGEVAKGSKGGRVWMSRTRSKLQDGGRGL